MSENLRFQVVEEAFKKKKLSNSASRRFNKIIRV